MAHVWHAPYSDLFDADDLPITKKQPHNHFAEWFVAIHLILKNPRLIGYRARMRCACARF